MSHKKHKKEEQEELYNEDINATEAQELDESEYNNVEEAELQSEESVLEKALQQIAILNDANLRQQAEFDNYRKRTLKEKMELSKTAGESILINLLPVIDDLERAMQSIEGAQDIESLKAGMELIYAKFSEFTKSNGIQEIKATGEAFDLDQHEAITKIPAPTDNLKGKIVDCVQKGYTLNGKVIRFSKVVIGE